MLEKDDTFNKEFNCIKKQNKIIKEYKNKNKPLLLFNSIDSEEPQIDISTVLLSYMSGKNLSDAEYFGSLMGEIKDVEKRYDFYRFWLKIICKEPNHPFYQVSKDFEHWIYEIIILCEFLTNTKIFDLKKIKIYKFEEPDILIELENQNKEILGIEITRSDVSDSSWFSCEELKLQEVLSKNGIYVKLRNYEQITDKNIENINNHFKNQKKYFEDIKILFPEKNIKIFYVITLGGMNRRTIHEKEEINKIKNGAEKFKIAFENIFLEISHKKSSYDYHTLRWPTLKKLVTDFNL